MSDGNGLPSASLFENVRFNALVVVPNAVQGIFRRRRQAVELATRANVDGHAVGLLKGMARSYDGPVWVRVVRDPALLLLDPADAARALDESPHPFASDPDAKRKGMVAFQPDALTISRGELWADRRRFTDAVLSAAGPPAGLADRFAEAARGEVDRLLAGPIVAAGGRLGWDDFHATVQRIARRVILGDGAAEDVALSVTLEELMSEANGMPGEPSEGLPAFMARLEPHLKRAEEGSLASLFTAAPSDEQTRTAGQVPHWLFALGDTLAINALRALAVLAAHDPQRRRAIADGAGPYTEACLQEAMRLWPTTTMLSRETLAETEWNGATVPAGTQVVIVNTFAHRNRDRIPYADRFAPEEWTEGDAAQNQAFNHFSRGPQGCPGQALALQVGTVVISELLQRRSITLRSPKLSPAKPLPHMLDFFGIELELGPS